ncbi:MAG: NAD(P)-binding domain-containing protein [Pseudomonadota bacterium]
MNYRTTVIIGAGQAGLAMSYELAARGIDHVVLERGQIANAWRQDRWDSLRLLTPNWQSRLPGGAYMGDDPDGFSSATDLAARLQGYAGEHKMPVETGIAVGSVVPGPAGYRVHTDAGALDCRNVVIATGACARPSLPALARELPRALPQFTTFDYKRASDLPKGGVLVVGGSATGLQLARELQRSGRQVILSVGEHVRAPRTYRGRDIQWWMDATGRMDDSYTAIDDIARVRRLPSFQLAGGADALDLNAVQSDGVEIVGRLAMIREGSALFSGGLRNHCALADLKLGRLLDGFDAWAEAEGIASALSPANRPSPTALVCEPRLSLRLGSGEIGSVLWATGFRPDHSFLDLPVFDRRGRLVHDGGIITGAPGLYAMGLPFMRRRKSTLIDGAGSDARDLAAHMLAQLTHAHAA